MPLLVADGPPIDSWSALFVVVGAGLLFLARKGAEAYTIWRETSRKARVDDIAADDGHWGRLLADLREENANQRKALSTLQDETLRKIISANDERHACEQRLAAIEAKMLSDNAHFLGEIAELKDRLRLQESHNGS